MNEFILGFLRVQITLHTKILLSIFMLVHFCALVCANDAASPPEPKSLILEKTFKNPDFQDGEPNIRIKDITQIEGIRENHLVGYGLVVGLNGTGDTLASSPQTQESLVSMLERLGINVRDGTMSGKNVAAVMVTATLPAFARRGSHINVNVSAIGDSKSLQGGTLLVTPLLGANGDVFAVGQGNIAVSGTVAQGVNASQTKGVPTAGKISNGGLVEKEVGYELTDLKEIRMILNTPDFTTAKRIAEAINVYAKQKQWGHEVAKALDMGTVQIKLKNDIRPLDFFHEVGHLEIKPDQKARVLIDTQKDIIVVSNGVKMSPCAVASGSTIVKIVEEPQVYMPNLPNGGIMPTVNTVVGVNTAQLADSAKQNTELVKSQNDQLKLLQDQQKAEMNKLEADKAKETDDIAKRQIETQIQQKKSVHEQQNTQLKQYFQQQLQAMQQQQHAPNAVGTQQQVDNRDYKGTSKAPEPVVVSQTKVNVREEKGKFNLLSSGATLEKFVNALNQLGVSVKDMGGILSAINRAGGLHAEIIMN